LRRCWVNANSSVYSSRSFSRRERTRAVFGHPDLPGRHSGLCWTDVRDAGPRRNELKHRHSGVAVRVLSLVVDVLPRLFLVRGTRSSVIRRKSMKPSVLGLLVGPAWTPAVPAQGSWRYPLVPLGKGTEVAPRSSYSGCLPNAFQFIIILTSDAV
jgi:hypothetical protein